MNKLRTIIRLYEEQTGLKTIVVELYIRKVLEEKRYADQANKICSGILGLARTGMMWS